MNTNILFIVPNIHLNGGGERVTFNMANYFINQNKSVSILSFEEKKENQLFPHDNLIKINYLNIKNSRIVSKFRLYLTLKKYIKYNHYDIIFGIGTYSSVILGMIKKYSSKIMKNTKIIGCEHSSFVAPNVIWNKIRNFTYPYLDSVVCLTNHDLKYFMELNSNAKVIPNAISVQQVKSQLNNKKFLSIGRLDKGKRFDLMIKIFKKFNELNKDWKLDIVGEGPEKENLEKLIINLNLQEYVFLHPFTNEVSKYYLNSSIFLMTSESEGLPMVLLEAKSFGLPIISYDCNTGPRDIILNYKDGFLISMDNDKLFLDAMTKLASDRKLLVSMSNHSIHNLNSFLPEQVYKKWVELINNL